MRVRVRVRVVCACVRACVCVWVCDFAPRTFLKSGCHWDMGRMHLKLGLLLLRFAHSPFVTASAVTVA